ncbi:MAG: biotin transporter BioY [Firmicutes bacterium]|nr:biotin transporter BioY [Bacillota bacterium]
MLEQKNQTITENTSTSSKRYERTKRLVQGAMFAALITVGAFIKIPMPIMSFTLQFLFTMLAGYTLGGKWGAAAVCIYIAMGLIGLPVFSEGGGISYVLKPSFGYIIGFAAGAYVTGTIANRVPKPGYPRLFAAAFAGLAVVYILGVGYLYVIKRFYIGDTIELMPFILYYILPDSLGDITLCVIASLLSKRLIPLINRK